MPDGAALLRLLAWLSPAFPVGSFSYSHGLERAVHDGLLPDAASLRAWLSDLLTAGSGWNDAVLFAEAWRLCAADAGPALTRLPVVDASAGSLLSLAQLAEALAGSQERHRESTLQGAAFLSAAAAWPSQGLQALPADCPYCVAVGAHAGAHGVPLRDALAAYLQAFASNLVQAAIRLGVAGQVDAVRLLAALEPTILATARRAATSTLDDLGSAAVISDIVSMQHETQHSRLFRS